MTATENVLNALQALLVAAAVDGGDLEGVTVADRNSALPEEIPAEGLLIVRDGNPGVPEPLLGGFSTAFYTHEIEIECYAADADASARNAAFSALLAGLGLVLEANETLSGTVQGFTYAWPSAGTEAVEGAEDIKSGTVILSADYTADSPLG